MNRVSPVIASTPEAPPTPPPALVDRDDVGASDLPSDCSDNVYLHEALDGMNSSHGDGANTSARTNSMVSESSVSALLYNAVGEANEECWNYWWNNVVIPVNLRGESHGRGRKRKLFRQPQPRPLKAAKLESAEEILCEGLELLTVSKDVVKCENVSNVGKSVETVVDHLADLALCDCCEDTCLACTVKGLCDLINCFNEPRSLLKVTPLCKVVSDAPAATDTSSEDSTQTCKVASDAPPAMKGTSQVALADTLTAGADIDPGHSCPEVTPSCCF